MVLVQHIRVEWSKRSRGVSSGALALGAPMPSAETERLQVIFDLPSHGWLGLDLRAGERRFVEHVSHIYPSLAHLCSGLCDVLNGAPSRPIVFYLEPAELELRIAPESDNEWYLSLMWFRDHRRSAMPAPSFEFRSTPFMIVSTFWRALRRLETALPAAEFAAQYCEPFPTLEMASLTKLVKAGKRAAG